MKHSFVFILMFVLLVASCSNMEPTEGNQSFTEQRSEEYRIPHSLSPLSEEEAIMVARQFFLQNEVRTKGVAVKEPKSVYAIGDQDNPAMFAVNYGENDGFVILNTSKKYFPVLAYSDKGHYAQDRNASGMDVWMDEQKALIEVAETLPLDSLKEVTKSWLNYEKNGTTVIRTKTGDPLPFREEAIAEWELDGYECMDLETSAMYLNPTVYNQWCGLAAEQSDPNYDYMESAVVLYYGTNSNSQVGPFLSTTWGREDPYNLYLSPSGTVLPPASSSIAAMAQIMRYYEWPTLYHWSTMSDTTATYYTRVLYYQLARDAETGINGETDINDLKNAITGQQYHYHYSASVVSHSLSTVNNNVNSGKPVFMEGKTSGGAKHAWVCDGHNTYTTAIHLILMVYTPDERYLQAENGGYYSDSNSSEYLHMNWGEDGAGNGWFYGDNSTFSRYVNSVWTQTNYSLNRKDIVNISPNN